MGCIGKVGMSRAQVPSELIEGIVPNEGARGDIQHAVIRVEFFDGGAALRRVTLSKNFLKVTEQ
jgi:hypothetical protein